MPDVNLSGQVLRVLFRDAGSLFSIVRLHTPEGEVTATGTFLEVAEGDKFELRGGWTHHAKYGRQFAAQEARKVLPETAAGIEAYLASGLFRGIGKKLAKRLVNHFGDQTLNILMQEPDRVREVPGIGPSKRRSLAESLGEYAKVQNVALFLQGHGVSLNLTMKIYQRYGDQSIEIVKANPYRLAREVEGIGFLTADEIARKLGADLSAPERVQAAVRHVLAERGEAEGHVFLPLGELVARSLEFLNRGLERPVVTPQLVREAIGRLMDEGWLVGDEGDAIYRREQYEAETDLAERVRDLLSREIAVHENLDALITEAEAELGVEYAPEQRAAVRTALTSPVAVITGGPGTGKSTVLLGVLTVLKKLKPDAAVLLAAPTGRAARRMTDVTGEPARTIHRLLGYNPAEDAFAVDEYSPLEGHLLVVDEFSMVDLNLAAALFAAVPGEMQVLLVGDADQLPSVGMGNVLADFISSGAVPVVRLTRIYRQAQESRIVLNAHRINAGQMPDLRTGPDFEFVRQAEPVGIVQYIRDRALAARDEGATLEQITVLTPMRKTETGVEALNKVLQEALNPKVRGRPEINFGFATFRLGDKVMQRKNNYEKEVFNGSVGIVSAVRGDDEDADSLVVTFEDEQRVEYQREELDQLILAYACTVHKSQGSEYGGLVMIPVTSQHYAMLQRNLLYTALTRAKQKAVLIGTEQAVLRAVKNNRITRRYSRLTARLRGEVAAMELAPLAGVQEAATRATLKQPLQAAAVYVAAGERSEGGPWGWAAVRVMAGGDRQAWRGQVAGVEPLRLLATAAGQALDGLEPKIKVVLCSSEPSFLAALDGEGEAPPEVQALREALGDRVWVGTTAQPDDPMLQECINLARNR